MNASQWLGALLLGSLAMNEPAFPSDTKEPPPASACDHEHPCFHAEYCVTCADGTLGCASSACVEGTCHAIPLCSGTRLEPRE